MLGTEIAQATGGPGSQSAGAAVSHSVPELLQRRGDADILPLLQPPLTVDQVVHTIYYQLHQFHLHQEHMVVIEGPSWEPHHLASPAARRGGTATPSTHMLAPAHGPGAAWALWARYADTFQNLPPQLCLAPTSDFPRRSRLEMSKTPPLAAVSTPPVPRFCSRRFSRILGKRLS